MENSDMDIGSALLKQDGLTPGEMLRGEQSAIHSILARDRKRVSVLKWLTFTFLVISVMCFLGFLSSFLLLDYHPSVVEFDAQGGFTIVKREPVVFWKELVTEGFPLIASGSFALAVLTGVAWSLLSRAVDIRAMNTRLKMMEMTLRASS